MSEDKFKIRDHKITLTRRIVQILSFLFINFLLFELLFMINLRSFEGMIKVLPIQNTPRNPYSKGGGIFEYILFYIIEGEFPYLLVGILIVIILLTNRWFCGWICPIGTIQDALCAIPTKKKNPKQETHDKLKNLKFIIVIMVVIIIMPLGWNKATNLVFYYQYKDNLGEMSEKPLGYFSLAEYIFVVLPNFIENMIENPSIDTLVDALFTWKELKDFLLFIYFIFFLILIIVAIWIPRVYCRYFCPFGGIASAISDYSLLKLQRSPVHCVGRAKCGICERVCPKQIKILDEPFEFFTGGGECNYCLKCMEACPYDAIDFKLG